MVTRPDSVRWVPSWSLIGEGPVEWCLGRAPPGQMGPFSGVCAELALGEGEFGGGAAERGRSGGARSHGRRSEGHAGRRWDRGPWAAGAARRRARFLVMVYFPAYCGSVGPGQPGTPRSGIRAVGRSCRPDRPDRSGSRKGPALRGAPSSVGTPGGRRRCHRHREAAVPGRTARSFHRVYGGGSGGAATGTAAGPAVAGTARGSSWCGVRNVRVSHERLLTGPACPLRHVDWWNRSHWCGLTVERQVSSVNTPVPKSCCRNNSTLQVS